MKCFIKGEWSENPYLLPGKPRNLWILYKAVTLENAPRSVLNYVIQNQIHYDLEGFTYKFQLIFLTDLNHQEFPARKYIAKTIIIQTCTNIKICL